MRSTGILRNSNEERGFGFIAPRRGGAELFVHVSAFPRDVLAARRRRERQLRVGACALSQLIKLYGPPRSSACW